MKKQSGITNVEFMVVLAITLLFLVIILPIVNIWRHGCHGCSGGNCGTNLKGIGTAMYVYANDYDGWYPQLSGKGPWSKELGFSYDLVNPNFKGAQSNTSRTITSSLYMLVREADVSPKSFICPRSTQEEFDGQNLNNLDIVELWDFGVNPYKHVSYAYHNPYGNFPAGTWLPASFVTMADMSPWFKDGNIQSPRTGEKAPQIICLTDPSTWKFGLSLNHKPNSSDLQEGHFVLWADGHSSYEKQPYVGVKNDNIYTFWSTENYPPTEQDIQGGTAPTSRSAENDAKSKDDSFLAI